MPSRRRWTIEILEPGRDISAILVASHTLEESRADTRRRRSHRNEANDRFRSTLARRSTRNPHGGGFRDSKGALSPRRLATKTSRVRA